MHGEKSVYGGGLKVRMDVAPPAFPGAFGGALLAAFIKA